MTITRRRARAALLALLWPAVLSAQDLPLPPGAMQTAQDSTDPGRYALPLAPWREDTGLYAQVIEGRIDRRAWRMPGSQATSQQLIAPIRDALQAAGYDIVLDCADARCGGFDFRFATEVLPAPAMFVTLTDFRFVSAVGQGGVGVSVLASRDDTAAYLQIIRAGTPSSEAGSGSEARAAPVTAAPMADQALIARLEHAGHAILRDVDFAPGDTTLGDGPVTSLDRLAVWLRDRPDQRLMFVGHTDATGSLAANRAVSRARAQSVVDYLTRRHGIGSDQIVAEGAGYLAPIASNLTPEGREANRRVEAVLLSAQ